MRYQLAKEAEADLREIARYTIENWGLNALNALNEYQTGINQVFAKIVDKSLPKKTFSKRFPNVQVVKYQYHYIFFQYQGFKPPLILGLIHERRDVVKNLADRLD